MSSRGVTVFPSCECQVQATSPSWAAEAESPLPLVLPGYPPDVCLFIEADIDLL